MLQKKSILDVFTQISSEHEASKPDLCIKLWNHLNQPIQERIEEESENEDEVPKEVTYALRRLVQGLGSPRAYIRKCYFASLVSILSRTSVNLHPLSLAYFKSIVDKQLSKFESKGEEGEVLTGRILAYGVAFRSKIFLNSTVELQQDVITEFLTKCKERSYLPPLVYTFLVDFLHTVDENLFKTVVWPVLVNEILLEWSSQTFETLYCLLEVHQKYPQLFKKKMILSIFKTHTILHEDTIENVVKMLTNITWEPRLKHPLFKTIGFLMLQSDNSELMLKFWTEVEACLHNSPTRMQQLAVFHIFCNMVKHLDLNRIPQLLTPAFVDHLINSCKSTMSKSDKLLISAKSSLQLIVSRATEKSDESYPTAVYRILCQLLFDSGHILIDKITGLKIVFPCIAKLDTKHVKLIAKKCKNIILCKKENSSNISWSYKDRSYAAQLLARLISHPQSQDMDWKIKHLKFMLKYAIFSPNSKDNFQFSNELASILKNSFFTALSHQLSHLENHRMVLISLVYYIDNMMNNGECELRTPLSNEILNCWKETMTKIQKIDLKINKTVKRKTVMYVFQTLFLQMALHLFVDAAVAQDILGELDRCYKKEKMQFKNLKSENLNSPDGDPEPKWIEIAVELFLSLLSRDTFLLRQLISRIFPHLCPYLTAQASFQILQVLDPNSGSSILTDDNEDSEEDEESDNDEDEEKDKIMEVDGEDESDSDFEEEEDIEESAIEKTRKAVRDALGVAGSVTDTESIDLDDIDEEEGRKLDMALSEAFKSAQKSQNKNKKQSVGDKALTNFRIRVMDLVDIYLDNDPTLELVLDTIPMLFSLLEFCIKDSHQKPLETRIRSTLKKIGNLKKCSKSDDVSEEVIANILKNLMDKGVRSTPVFLDLCSKISECCTFLLRMGTHISSDKNDKKNKDVLLAVINKALENFFLKRDCLLPLSLFENILMKINWNKNIQLSQNILSYVFSSSVRGFRRNQGLTLLCSFYKNTRLLSTLKETNDQDYAKLEDDILSSTMNLLLSSKEENTQKLKPSFMLELFSLLYSIKSNKFCMESSKWNDLAKLMQSFLNNGSFGIIIWRKYVIKLCELLKVTLSNESNNSRKRKSNDEELEKFVPHKSKKNGYISNSAQSEGNMNENNEITENPENINGNILNHKTVIKKKKSRRKTKEHYNSKQLRNESLVNNVEVFNFSKANIMEV